MARVFKDSALAYNAVLDHFKNQPTGNVLTIRQVWEALSPAPYMKNELQVKDAIVKYYNKGLISRMREGQAYAYWYTPKDKPQNIVKEVGLSPVLLDFDKPITRTTSEVPDIKITDTCIFISHTKYKLTLELS